MKTGPFRILLVLSAFLFLIAGCSKKDEPTAPKEDPLISGDYFPTNNTFYWKYSSNVFSKDGKSFVEFDIKIGTHTFRSGNFNAILSKLADSTSWVAVFSIKDSSGIVYSLGDNPPERPYPLFKHQYSESEVTRETITVNGKTYEALKKVLAMDSDSLTLWFADGIGLVKEFSRQGMSLFNDQLTGSKTVVTTELITCARPKLVRIRDPFGGELGPVGHLE